MATLRLSQMRPGDIGTISMLYVDDELAHRLLALGFQPGRQLRLVRAGRLSGPLHVQIGTTHLMLRPRDAACIELTLAESL